MGFQKLLDRLAEEHERALEDAKEAKSRIASLEQECAELRAALQRFSATHSANDPVYFDESVERLGFEVAWKAAHHESNFQASKEEKLEKWPVITHVAKDSAAFVHGIEPGQVLLEINGSSTCGQRRADLLPMLRARPLSLRLARQYNHTPQIAQLISEPEGEPKDEGTQPVPSLPQRVQQAAEYVVEEAEEALSKAVHIVQEAVEDIADLGLSQMPDLGLSQMASARSLLSQSSQQHPVEADFVQYASRRTQMIEDGLDPDNVDVVVPIDEIEGDSTGEKKAIADGANANGCEGRCQTANTYKSADTCDLMSLFAGEWVDNSGRFFGGSIVIISQKSWRPKCLFNADQEGAQFSWKVMSSNQIRLEELRADGTVRTFFATAEDDANQIIVTIEGAPLRWTLDRMLSTSTSKIQDDCLRRGDTMPEYIKSSRMLVKVRSALRSEQFEYFSGSIILANAIFIGFQADTELNSPASRGVKAVEVIFLAWFAFEACLRGFVKGRGALKDSWLLFDVVLVGLAFVEILLSNFLDTRLLQKTIILRVVRLMRLMRVLKVSRHFRVGWKLAYGLFQSFATVWSSCIMMVLFLYVFALAALELISKSESFQELGLVEPKFADLSSTMLTLFQFVTMDSIADIYRPLIEANPFLVFYFLPLFMLMSITLLNLVTAVTVDVALELTREDRDTRISDLQRKKASLEPIISQWFDSTVKDGRASITADDLKVARSSFPSEITDQICVGTIDDLFEVIDSDASGNIDREEFVEGVLNLSECRIASTETTLLLKILKILGEIRPDK